MRLLIAVKSCQRDKRDGAHQAIRETWGKKPPVGFDLVFFMGGDKAPSNLEEDEFYLSTSDNYWDLHAKVALILRYALWKDYDFTCLCDTDAYFEFPKMLKSGFENYDYSGGPQGGAGIFGKAYPAVRLEDHKNIIVSPFYVYLSGHAFVISRAATKIIVASQDPHTMSEDVWVAHALGPFIISGEITAKVLPEGVAKHLNCGYYGGGRATTHPECKFNHDAPVPRENVAAAIRRKHKEVMGQKHAD